MEDDDVMRRLLEQLLPCLYSGFVPDLNITTQDSIVQGGYITKDFFENILFVLSLKQSLITQRWETFVAKNCLKMVSSHETYFEYIMFACITETGDSDDVFDRVLSASALVIAFNIETLEKTGANFCELTVDIFMVFYKRVLKEQFCRQGGFEQFTEYLCREFLTWKCLINDDPQDTNIPVINREGILKSANKQFDNELKKAFNQPEFITHNDIRSSICHFLAKEVLLNTKNRLPTLPNSAYLNAFKKQKVEKLEETKRNAVASKSETTASSSNSGMSTGASRYEKTPKVLERSSISVTDSQARIVVEREANVTWCDNIVRAVIDYNNSKSSSLVNVYKQIQKADEIREHLNDTIKSLIEILMDQNKELSA